MDEMKVLLYVIKILRLDLPDLVGEDWPASRADLVSTSIGHKGARR